MTISAGTGAIRIDNCVFFNQRIVFSFVGTGLLIITNTTMHNGSGTLCIDSGANVMTIMAGNLTSDKALGANVTVVVAGFNNQFSKPI